MLSTDTEQALAVQLAQTAALTPRGLRVLPGQFSDRHLADALASSSLRVL